MFLFISMETDRILWFLYYELDAIMEEFYEFL
jgi:hypothetical protein